MDLDTRSKFCDNQLNTRGRISFSSHFRIYSIKKRMQYPQIIFRWI